jgi:alcohol dehydrogenase (cytochrome c)
MNMLAKFFAPFCAIAIASLPAGAAKSAPDSTDSQATYRNNCASCHGQNMEGGQFGPTLKGPAFQSKWSTGNQAALLDFIEHSMPPANPGVLTHQQYASMTELIGSSTKPSVDGPSGGEHNAEGVMDQLRRSHLGVEPAPPELFQDDQFRVTQQHRKEILSRLTPIDDSVLQSSPEAGWIAWRGNNGRQSFSRLSFINKDNVAAMNVAWSWSLAIGPNEIEPLVHQGVMFVNSGTDVQALDAESGDLLWAYRRQIPEQYAGSISGIHRNMALYGTNIYISTNDRHVVALDTKTGTVVWDKSVVPDYQPTVVLSAGPIIAHGKVIQSSSGGPGCIRGCQIIALDANTGNEIWRFNSIAAEGAGAGNSWNGLTNEKRSGGGIWIAGSYDPGLNLAFYGVGQTYKIQPLLAPLDKGSTRDALYTDSTLALDADTGRLAWFHQHLRRDIWDLDEAFERTRVTLPAAGGHSQNALVTVGKSGILDAIEPTKGNHLFTIDLGLQNHATIDPKTGLRTISQSLDPKPGVSQFICPSLRGARNWMTTAYDPDTHVMYLPMEETCMNITFSPNTNDMPFDIGWNFAPRPHSDGNYGRVQAIDLATKKSLWTNRYRTPPASSMLATRGGIVFVGNRDRSFQALDSRSGKTLWQVRLNAVPDASPITYAVNGRQYVAVVAGGGGPQDSSSDEITPEIRNSAPATTLWVFRLPSLNAAP